MLPGSSDLRRVLTVDKSNDQAAQGGQDLWRILMKGWLKERQWRLYGSGTI